MRNSHKLLGVVVGAAFSLNLAASAQTAAAPKVVGFIDRDRVVAAFPKAQTAAEELKTLEAKLQKTIEDANKQYDDAKKAKKPQAELDTLQKSLQVRIDDEGKRFQARVSSMESDLEGAVDGAIKLEAAQHHVDVVLLKQAVLFGGVDLTDGVVRRLAANAAAKTSTNTTTK
jgi:Skp family chaperone for outer membrane proteins